jgi:hypothetical protein
LGAVGRGEGAGKFGLEPIKRLTFGALLIAPNKVSNIFADSLVGAVVADVRGDELTQRPADPDMSNASYARWSPRGRGPRASERARQRASA